MKLLSRLNRRGFTLIELMIVMSIVGILASIAAPNFRWGLIKAKESVLREQLYTLNSTIDQFFADKGKYPDSLSDLTEGSLPYLPRIPKDPFTGQPDWVTLAPMGSSDGAEIKGNIYRVKSNSPLRGSDGKPYNEWE